MIQRDITLCGVPHRVTEIDGQVIFLNTSGFSPDQFTLEWNGCGWDFVDMEAHFEKIFVAHISAAYKWVQQHYLPHYVDGTAKVIAFQDEPIKDPQT